MTCLFNPVGCVLDALPWWAPWAFWGCVALIVFGVAWKLVLLAKSLGGTPAAAGAVGLVATVLGVVASILRPGKRVKTEEQYPHPDDRPPPARQPPILRDVGEPVDDWFERATGRRRK